MTSNASLVANVPAPVVGGQPKHLGVNRHLALSSFWFGNFFLWIPLTSVVLQIQVDSFIPKGSQNTAIGVALCLGGVLAMAVPPLVGGYSDRVTTRWGRRRPIMVGGIAGAIVGLAIMAAARNYPMLVVGYLFVQGFSNAAGAAYAGLVPDIVPAQEFGRASGFLATMVLVGSGAGLGATIGLGGLDLRFTYLAMAAVVLLSVLPTLWVARGEGMVPVPRVPKLPLLQAAREFLRPMAGGDFGWVIFTRLFVSAGIVTVQSFLLNFFRDVVGVANPKTFTSLWLIVVLLTAVPFALAAGHFSDRYGRKIFVYLSGAFQSIVALVFVIYFPTSVPLIYATGVLYGAGYGCYYAVDWALACDTLPDRTKPAKDMGLFHVALTLPGTYVPFVAGWTLDTLNRHAANSGYRVIFAAAVVFLIMGTVFVSRIKSVR